MKSKFQEADERIQSLLVTMETKEQEHGQLNKEWKEKVQMSS